MFLWKKKKEPNTYIFGTQGFFTKEFCSKIWRMPFSKVSCILVGIFFHEMQDREIPTQISPLSLFMSIFLAYCYVSTLAKQPLVVLTNLLLHQFSSCKKRGMVARWPLGSLSALQFYEQSHTVTLNIVP